MLSFRLTPALVALALGAASTWPIPAAADPGEREWVRRYKEQQAERREAQRREGERAPRPAPTPPGLRGPSERPAPDAHRPPRGRDDARGERHRSPHWNHGSHWNNDPWNRDRRGWDDGRRGWDHAPRYHYHAAPRYRPGHHVPRLSPGAHVSLHFGRHYWFDNGYWYTPASNGYVLVRPPGGVYLHALPPGYTLVRVGPTVYYQANGVYYTAAPSGGYMVAEVASQDDPDDRYQPPMVYPARGQSPEQQGTDEYECHVWAVDRAGFDPTLAGLGQGPEGDEVLRGNYVRALTACLEGRGYSVR